MGFFGAFECIDNQKAGQILVNAGEVWLKEKGMDSIRGPINPVAENWGFVPLELPVMEDMLKKNILMEANYILEDNYRIRNALEKLGMSYIKTYRVYEKSLNR